MKNEDSKMRSWIVFFMPATLRFALCIFCFALLLGTWIVSPAFAESDNSDLQKGKMELQGIRKEIKEKKKGLAEAGKKEEGLVAEIEKIEKKLDGLEVEERKLDKEIILLEKGLKEKTASISELTQEAERKKRLLYKRLIFIYKTGDTGYLRYFLSPEGIADIGRKYKYMVSIAAHDRALIEGYGRDMKNLSIQMDGIRSDRDRLEGTQEELEKKRVEIKKKRGERDRLLAEVRKEKHYYKESLKELEANARNLEQLLDRLERQASVSAKGERIKSYPDSGFKLQKGLLDFPAKGEIVGFFGKETDESSKTTIYRKGIEIQTRAGSEIKAVHNGRVIFAGHFRGYGLMIIIDHGDGYYTIYARAAKLLKKLNDEINKGDIIGTIGEKNSSLYFEVRKGGKPENPLEWLRS